MTAEPPDSTPFVAHRLFSVEQAGPETAHSNQQGVLSSWLIFLGSLVLKMRIFANLLGASDFLIAA
ncbi:MAG: hypothetical protein IPL51_15565 [Candidatus Competibacteraceae bacterium]|nr:hypothetical protein [Candidatus Competibacteraceae bacterium]